MTVNPGFGGQEFIPSTLGKIERLRALITQHGATCDLEVDGGIHTETAAQVVRAGANALVAGSAIYGEREGVTAAIQRLRTAAG
jgi:ribulose-phosphate 3-epimerase